MGVEIKKDHVVRNKFHRGFSRKWGKVKEIIIHGTGGGGTLEWVRSGGRAHQYYMGVALFHYLIQEDGTIWEIIDPDRWVYHSCSGRKDRNRIGIEIVNRSRSNSAPYSDKQYESLYDLVFKYLMDRYPSINTIMSHKRAWQKASRGRRWKECPGPKFDWKRLERVMVARGFTYKHHPRFESYWNIRKV